MVLDKYLIGSKYTRTEIRNLENDPGTMGKWDRGYLEHNKEIFIFSTYGGESYTGIDYGDKWIDSETFFWNGQKKSNVQHKHVKMMLDPNVDKRLFVRKSNSNKNKLKGAPFTYKGLVNPIKVSGENPINIIWKVNSNATNYIEMDDVSNFDNVGKGYSIITFSNKDTALLSEREVIKRSDQLKKDCLKLNNYQCEINFLHDTFKSKRSEENYMETHHIIPISAQKYYDNKLDCLANISCLCPTCHRLIHYGIWKEKLPLLRKLYDSHFDNLKKSGIILQSFDAISIYYK
ncbi:DUF3427 domain-containing protein [Listeria monocytogenes]|nr:DUF3427 domain-containing protein [Listeria monocytogenes]EAF2233844.1 DUF3427 domain-containing protein [Listeria monocytogenes]EAG3579805.1 DUF3427 domain-containing protein [Listeria monocytogenes]EAW7172417.1 DUF3427 domain-containing protein [Listeria monocytogenes]EAW7207813.1 DUF3427 domain-containing protein [Listeria monocytogenes]